MNGPQNYRMAEKLLQGARENKDADTDLLVATAQVHATLALVAVTREQGSARHITEWDEATR